jgi:hypothetical protein
VIESVGKDQLAAAAETASYVGSPEHKGQHTWLGQPKLRSDATPCPSNLHDRDLLTSWLKAAILAGRVSDQWSDKYPRYVWFRNEDDLFEGRLVNLGNGEYKGYPIKNSQAPKGFS